MSDGQQRGWGGTPSPQQAQPVVNRQCQHCGWPTPAVEPVCRNCGTDVRAGARPPTPAYQPSTGGYSPTTNGMAIASLVLGILWLYWIGSVLALVFGYIARQQIQQRHGRQGGRGLATAGIVLGWIGVGFLVLFILVGMIGLASDPAYDALPLHRLPF